MFWIIWVVFTLLLMAGLVGSFIPALPGLALVLGATLLHKWLLPEYLSWWTVGVTGLAFVLSFGIDLLGTVVGTKWGGASKKGMYGSIIGGIVGIFFGIPGLILGPILGAIIGEIVALRTPEEAARSGIGAGFGFAISTALRVMLTFFVIVWIVVDCFVG